MHIEFIGLPGAGKTTLSQNLLSSLQRDGETYCISSEEAFLQVSRYRMDRVLRHPMRLLPQGLALKFAEKLIDRSRMQFDAQSQFIANHGLALGEFLQSRTFSEMSDLDRQIVIGAFLSVGAIWQCTNTTIMNDKVIFFEEGLVQKSFMFVSHSQRNNSDKLRVLNYLENIPQTDMVVCVVASMQTCWDRMLSRSDGLTDRLKHCDKKAIRDYLKAAEAHIDMIVEWLSIQGQESLILVNSEDNIASEIDLIKNRVKQLKPQDMPLVSRRNR